METPRFRSRNENPIKYQPIVFSSNASGNTIEVIVAFFAVIACISSDLPFLKKEKELALRECNAEEAKNRVFEFVEGDGI